MTHGGLGVRLKDGKQMNLPPQKTACLISCYKLKKDKHFNNHFQPVTVWQVFFPIQKISGTWQLSPVGFLESKTSIDKLRIPDNTERTQLQCRKNSLPSMLNKNM